MPRRRFSTFVVFATVGLATLFLLSSSSRQIAADAAGRIEVPASISNKFPTFEVPDLHWSFQISTQKPAEQKNSTGGGTSWYTDWRWLNPFSSSVTLDEERAVLPLLAPRPPVYTYYDTTVKREKELGKADAQLLLTWKRAWWAKGFRPVVLTQADAMNNPLFQGLHAKGMPKNLEAEFTRWMAWANVDSGLLATTRCIPMAAGDDKLLSSLRYGNYDGITKYEGLGSGLFAGEKSAIISAVRTALGDARLSTYKNIIEAIGKGNFKTQQASSIANYDSDNLSHKYSKVARMIEADAVNGNLALNQLMTAHLHTTWQNTFSAGVSVLKPLAAHSTKLVEPGQHLARLLTECPASVMQSSCPPNLPRCSPCVGSKMRTSTAESFKNQSTLFTIATIPHPFTMVSLNALSDQVNVSYVRRKTDRDPWIRAATRDVLGDGRGGPSRVVSLKDSIASDHSRRHGLWLTAEDFPLDIDAQPEKPKSPTNDAHPESQRMAGFPEAWLEELDWHFGFPIPRHSVKHGESYNPVPGQKSEIKGVPEDRKSSYEPRPPTYPEEQQELEILIRARKEIQTRGKLLADMRKVAEAWNMADHEVWRFARAFRAREVVERKQWEQEEASPKKTGSRGGRWWRRQLPARP